MQNAGSKMAGDAEIDFLGLTQELEVQELEGLAAVADGTHTWVGRTGKELKLADLAPGGVATPQLYGQLLALYLLQNDLCNAKFLWKRIPQSIKTANPELSTIWVVGQRMWLRDLPGVYEALKKEWSEAVKPIMMALRDSVHKKAFNLVRLGYSSISVEDFALFVGLSTSDAKQAALQDGWMLDSQSRFLTPKKLEPVITASLPSEQHLSILTDYVSFLEN